MLEPRGEDELTLGIFETNMPEPPLYFVIEPDIGELLNIAITRYDQAGEYALVCCLHNASELPCRITVREAGAGQ
jgi:hypothetical protein